MRRLKNFIKDKGLSQASVARSIGVSAGAISQYLKGVYKGNNVDLKKRINTYIANYQTKEIKADKIIETRDFKVIHFTIDETIIAGVMGVIYGKAGSGKTVAIKEYAKAHPEAILIETTPMISASKLLQQILAHLGNKNAIGSPETLLHECVAQFKKAERTLIIDEAENLTTNNLNNLRRIHDFSGVPVVLVGTYALLQNLKGRSGELLQLYSRIEEKWEMLGLNEVDRKNLFGSFGKYISKYTKDIRRSCTIYRKAKRLSVLQNKTLDEGFIKLATQAVILD